MSSKKLKKTRCHICKGLHDHKELCPEWKPTKPLEPVFSKKGYRKRELKQIMTNLEVAE